jgi:hypothetical protein
VLRNSASAPVGLGAELRLVDATRDALILGWMHSEDETIAQTLKVRRALYDEIAADADGEWAPLRTEMSAGSFVDMNRMLVVTAE